MSPFRELEAELAALKITVAELMEDRDALYDRVSALEQRVRVRTSPKARSEPPTQDLNGLLTVVSDVFDVPRAQIAGQGRTKQCLAPRQAFTLLASQRGVRMVDISRVLNRDHSSVSHSRARAAERVMSDYGFALRLQEIVRRTGDQYVMPEGAAT